MVSIVGDVHIASPRTPLFAKELRLVVSRSYGPGRYDPLYEDQGIDYPAGYVRWTEGRNLEEVVRLMAAGQLRPSRLTTHTFDLADGAQAYAALEGGEPSLGILLRYPELTEAGTAQRAPRAAPPRAPSRAGRGSASSARARSPAACSCRRSHRHADIAAVANATGRLGPRGGPALRRRPRDHRRRRGAAQPGRSTRSSSPPATTPTRPTRRRPSRRASTSSSRSRWPSTRTSWPPSSAPPRAATAR